MTSLDPSPLMVSLAAATTNLPLLLFALPAGAIADIVDRRMLLIVAQIFMLALTLVLLAWTATGLISPLMLLALIILIEAGTAFEIPAYLAALPNLVPRDQLQPALALNGVGINLPLDHRSGAWRTRCRRAWCSRRAGNQCAKLRRRHLRLCAIAANPRETCLPAEHFMSAMRTGLRFAHESSELKSTLVRATAFFLFASAYLALLPLIARDRLDAGVAGLVLLFGCHGGGAVLGALLLPYVRVRFLPDQVCSAEASLPHS